MGIFRKIVGAHSLPKFFENLLTLTKKGPLGFNARWGFFSQIYQHLRSSYIGIFRKIVGAHSLPEIFENL